MPNAHKVSTFADARAWFSETEPLVHHSALREVINLMIDKKIRTEFDNDSFLDALILTEVMFERSTGSIRMLSGPGCGDFLKSIQRSFVSAVKRLATNGGKFKLLTISDAIPEFVQETQRENPNTLEVGLLKLRDPANQIQHFLVCDSKMARIEEPHGPLTEDTPVNAVKAKVYFNDAGKAQFYEDRFEAFWGALFSPQLA
jgi:hypothetical protein